MMSSTAEVFEEDTFDCVIRQVKEGYKTIALDFASGTNPGGGWRAKKHHGTQEESLCKRSDLGVLLERERYPIPNNGQIYVPVASIIKDRDMHPIKPVKCEIIASEIKGISESSSSYIQMKISNLYNIAIDNNYDVIVLGAWGCGAFSETPDDADIMSKHFKVCADNFQHRIQTVFAIHGKKNYKVFKKNICIDSV